MNKYKLLINNYLKHNSKVYPYYTILLCIKIFSILILLCTLYIYFYYYNIMGNNKSYKSYKVNIGNTSNKEAMTIFNSIKYIEKISNDNHVYVIELNDIKNSNSFLSEMKKFDFEIVLSNENMSTLHITKLLYAFKITFFVLYFILFYLFLYILTIFFKKELPSLKLFHFIGYSKKNILEIITSLALRLIVLNSIIILNILVLILLIFKNFRVFFINKILTIFSFILIIYLFYFCFMIILENKLINKYIKK